MGGSLKHSTAPHMQRTCSAPPYGSTGVVLVYQCNVPAVPYDLRGLPASACSRNGGAWVLTCRKPFIHLGGGRFSYFFVAFVFLLCLQQPPEFTKNAQTIQGGRLQAWAQATAWAHVGYTATGLGTSWSF